MEIRDLYLTQRLERLNAMLTRLRSWDDRFVWLRLSVFIGGVAAAFTAYSLGPDRLGWMVLLGFLALFVYVAYRHRRLVDLRERIEILRSLAKIQIARRRLDWGDIPQPVLPQPVQIDELERDLDLVGERSLHHLLDVSHSLGGSQRLRSWLSEKEPEPAQIHRRQELVKELIPLSGFRGRLALTGARVFGLREDKFDGDKLLAWLDRRSATGPLRTYLWILAGFALVNAALFILHALSLLPAIWPFTLLVYMGVYWVAYRSSKDLFSQSFELQRLLRKFSEIAACLETYRYAEASQLAGLCAPFADPRRRPSRYIRGVSRVVSAAGLQQNAYLWLLLNALMPWDLYFAYRLEQYKQAVRGLLPGWLDTWYELEALHSLSNFAFLNPETTFPRILDPGQASEPVFAAQDLGHPLIPAGIRVSNSFTIQNIGDLALITGSNMSGKSTFLRTLGINLCLAYAGGPVAASGMQSMPFRLYTCIQVVDSLANGISYFYAEVRRLKGLLVELGKEHPAPGFYLIDEIFRGTNNRERQIGSQAFVRALVGQEAGKNGRGVGLISTHDLELAHLADELPHVSQYHFRERVEADRLIFEYRLRPGPSQTTNALKIMQMEGLPV